MDYTMDVIKERIEELELLRDENEEGLSIDDDSELDSLRDFVAVVKHEGVAEDFVDELLNHFQYYGDTIGAVQGVITDADYCSYDSVAEYGENMLENMGSNIPDNLKGYFDFAEFGSDCLNEENDFLTMRDGTIIVLM